MLFFQEFADINKSSPKGFKFLDDNDGANLLVWKGLILPVSMTRSASSNKIVKNPKET